MPAATAGVGDPWSSPGFLLWHATLRWQRLMTRTTGELGLTHVQFVLLASTWWLAEHGEPPRQRDLADHAGTDPMTTSQVVRALVAKGLLQRTADAHDGRAWRLQPTEAGRVLAREAVRRADAADRAFFAAVPAAARDSVVPTLRVLAGGEGGSRGAAARAGAVAARSGSTGRAAGRAPGVPRSRTPRRRAR